MSLDTTKSIRAVTYNGVNIPLEQTGADPVINPLSVTANGTYTAPSGVDGYSPVTVNVPQGITPSGKKLITDTSETDVAAFATAQVSSGTLLAENIKKDVNILGVIGTFEGGGGSLPTSISKIDGGSFTLASDTDCRVYDIAHNLGVVPKAFVIWTEDITAGVAQSVIYLMRANYFEGGYNATTVATNLTLRIGTNGAMTTNGAGITAANVSTWVTSAKICANYNTNYKAGITYKWLAWA